MRRANGTGTVVKLSGNRRRPYAVRVSVRDKYGRLVQKAVSYHAKLSEAQAALDAYNDAHHTALTGSELDRLTITVGKVYELWSARKYAKAGDASVTSYRSSWSRVQALAGMKMKDVSIDHLQRIIDADEAAGLSQSTLKNDRLLMRSLFRYAMERDIVDKDYSAFIQMPSVGAKHEKGVFNDLQMKHLEEMSASGRPWADTVLMLCYTGFRINEFLSLTPFAYDREGDYLRGGSKTRAGRDRIVPVHPKIKPYLLRWLSRGGSTIICGDTGRRLTYDWYCKHAFNPIVAELGLPQATPHWCRHTAFTRLHAAGAPDLEIKRILGHADSNVTEHYTKTDIEQLRAAILLLA